MKNSFNKAQVQWLNLLEVDGLWGKKFVNQNASNVPIPTAPTPTAPIPTNQNIVVDDNFTSLDQIHRDIVQKYLSWGFAHSEHDILLGNNLTLKAPNILTIQEFPLFDDIYFRELLSGDSGILFEKMLSFINLTKEEVVSLPFFNNDNIYDVKDNHEEWHVAKIKALIALYNPQVIWCFDYCLLKFLIPNFDQNEFKDLNYHIVDNKQIPVICSVHPSVLLNQCNLKSMLLKPLNQIYKLIV